MIKRLLAILLLILGFGLMVGYIVFAQEAPESQEPAAPPAPQKPRTPPPSVSIFAYGDGGAYLGVYVENINRENMGRYGLSEPRGVGITEVLKDSPAEKAGLRKGDVVLRFDNEPVTSVRKLNRLVNEDAPDHNAQLGLSRGGSELEVSVTLSRRKEFSEAFGANQEDWWRGGNWSDRILVNPGEGGQVFSWSANRRIGISTQRLTKQLAEYFGARDGGLLITAVSENSPAAKAGLKAGDVITAIDGEKVESSGDIVRAINKKQDGDITLTIIRDRSPRTVSVTPEKAPTWHPGASTGRSISIPEMDIQIPEIQMPHIVLPSIPEIKVTVPQIRVQTGGPI